MGEKIQGGHGHKYRHSCWKDMHLPCDPKKTIPAVYRHNCPEMGYDGLSGGEHLPT